MNIHNIRFPHIKKPLSYRQTTLQSLGLMLILILGLVVLRMLL